MLELSRTVRFCINDPPDADAGAHNTFSAWPAMRGLGRYYELHVACRGEPDERTGYLMNIKRIDRAVREHALPILRGAAGAGRSGDAPMGELLRRMMRALQPALDEAVDRLTLSLTPRHALTLGSTDMDRVAISQQYEFSAAHRLHVEALSERENREVFGKCNNPAGHGHNYRVQVTISAPIDGRGQVMRVEQLDRLVSERVIDKLDHKHLNRDVPQFAELNPSVEHIAKVIWEMLAGVVEAIDGRLVEVGVWETEKTVCRYRGPQVETGV